MLQFGFPRQYIKPVQKLLIWLEGLNPASRRAEPLQDYALNPPEAQGLNLSVMSFNIRRGTREDGGNHWIFRRPLVREVLERYRPDVLGLQEALDFQISAIRAMLPGYEKVGVGNLGDNKGLHTAIFYDARRFAVSEAGTLWFSETPHIPRSRGWGNIIPRTCTWARLIDLHSRQAFYCFNVHLDHLSRRSRKRSVMLLSRLIQNRRFPDPFVLTGDFNAGEKNNAIRFLRGKGTLKTQAGRFAFNPEPLIDTFRDRYPDHPRVATYHGFRRYFFRFRFDYIFVPPSVQVKETKIIRLQRENCFPSDHFPLLSSLVLSAEQPSAPLQLF